MLTVGRILDNNRACWTNKRTQNIIVGRTDGHKMGMFDELMDKNIMIGRTDGHIQVPVKWIHWESSLYISLGEI